MRHWNSLPGEGIEILYYLLLLELKKPVKGFMWSKKYSLVVHPYNR
jgi:hypothetical protein